MILVVNASIAQTKLGIKLTSSIISQRISSPDDFIEVEHGANAFIPSPALFADLPLSRNYFFSTGIGYISKRVNLKVHSPFEISSQSKNYNIQYLQIPATLKLYTNEVALDKKLYFQFGPVFDIAVHDKEKDKNISVIDEFNPLDITLQFGTGLELQLAPNTAVQLGISYGRGLINIVRSNSINEDLSVKNDLYGIEIAVKF